MVAIQPHNLHQLVGKFRLLVFGEIAEQAGVIHILLLADLLDQGHQTAAQRGKKYVALAHGQPVFVFVQPVIIGMHIRCAVFGKADIGFKNLFQIRLKQGEIIGFLGGVPFVVGLHQ